jgi:hypothetical protein
MCDKMDRLNETIQDCSNILCLIKSLQRISDNFDSLTLKDLCESNKNNTLIWIEFRETLGIVGFEYETQDKVNILDFKDEIRRLLNKSLNEYQNEAMYYM